jgi:hypothetical protein
MPGYQVPGHELKLDQNGAQSKHKKYLPESKNPFNDAVYHLS